MFGLHLQSSNLTLWLIIRITLREVGIDFIGLLRNPPADGHGGELDPLDGHGDGVDGGQDGIVLPVVERQHGPVHP